MRLNDKTSLSKKVRIFQRAVTLTNYKYILFSISLIIFLQADIYATKHKKDENTDLKSYSFRPGMGIATMKILSEKAPVKQYFSVNVSKRPTNDWDIQLGRRLKTAVNAKDVCYIEFYARSIRPLPGKNYSQVTALVELASPPWNKLLLQKVKISKDWKRYVLAFNARPSWGRNPKNHYAPGETHVAFNFGAGRQKINIGPVVFCNMGKNPKRSEIPIQESSYVGRELGAKWRLEAEKRIEKLRKVSAEIKAFGKDGRPLKNAEVKIKMLRHHFSFGSCINLSTWEKSCKDGKTYREEFKKLFNMAVFEGAMKWRTGWDYKESLKRCISWLRKNDIDIRGHCLVWPSWKYTKDFLRKLKNNPDDMKRVIRNHVYYQAGVLKNDIVEWDVVNEVYSHNDILKITGRNVMVDWFKTAKAAAPESLLYANDYDILTTADDYDNVRRKDYFKMVKYLQAKGTPIDGIGMQSHFTSPATPENMLKVLNNFSSLGLDIKITEYDFVSFNEKLQADFTRDIMTVAFSHPQVTGFLMWGFWDGRHWGENAPCFYKDWSLKPAGNVYKELVFKKWWTELSGSTNTAGKYTFSGFKGTYNITVKHGEKIKAITRKLIENNTKIILEL
jgi:GH35 family endo-1,4-beta-xylanase